MKKCLRPQFAQQTGYEVKNTGLNRSFRGRNHSQNERKLGQNEEMVAGDNGQRGNEITLIKGNARPRGPISDHDNIILHFTVRDGDYRRNTVLTPVFSPQKYV